jgi:hypothetical protein
MATTFIWRRATDCLAVMLKSYRSFKRVDACSCCCGVSSFLQFHQYFQLDGGFG